MWRLSYLAGCLHFNAKYTQHFTNVHDANAAIDGLDDCDFMGNTIHVEMSKNQNHKPGPRRDNPRNDARSDGPPPMQMPPAGYNMPGMPYGPPPPHMPPAGYGMPPMQVPMPGPESSSYNGAAAGMPTGSAAPSSTYPGYPPPYGMPYPPPPMPVFSRSAAFPTFILHTLKLTVRVFSMIFLRISC